MDQLEIASSMRLLKKYFETKKNASSTEQASTCYHSKIDVESHLPNFVCNETIGKVGWLHYKILYLYGCKTRNILWRKAWAILTSNTLCLHIRRKYNILSFISREFVIPIQLRNFDVYPVWDLASASASLSSPKQCVFRLFTCNSTDTFTELYLQAANIQEMCEWIHELRRHAKGRMPKNPPSLPVHLSLGTRAIKNSAQRHNTKNIPNSNNKSQSILVDNIHFNDDRFSIRRHFSNYIFRKPTTKLAFRRDSLCSKLPSQFKG
ncbi:hypothetical protein GJ496_000909 [Pomphorhynchus laevis]|nr:hypothetical protein GJ496_000909 [Pomphorhynchus laevis]